MKCKTLLGMTLGTLFVWESFSTAAYAWTGPVTIAQLATEAPGLLEVNLTTTPSSTCSSPSWQDLPATGSGSSPSATDFKSASAVLLAAFLYNKPVNLNFGGCDSLNRPIIIGVIMGN